MLNSNSKSDIQKKIWKNREKNRLNRINAWTEFDRVECQHYFSRGFLIFVIYLSIMYFFIERFVVWKPGRVDRAVQQASWRFQ
jgi:hypothetical protein